MQATSERTEPVAWQLQQMQQHIEHAFHLARIILRCNSNQGCAQSFYRRCTQTKGCSSTRSRYGAAAHAQESVAALVALAIDGQTQLKGYLESHVS